MMEHQPEFIQAPLLRLLTDDDAKIVWPSSRTAHQQAHSGWARGRLMSDSADALEDSYVLEQVLAGVETGCNAGSLASELLTKFGGFADVISASPSRLSEVNDLSTAAISQFKIIQTAAHRLARCRIVGREVISSWDALLKYCRTVMVHQEIEQFRILYLDRKNTLITDEKQQQGTVDHVPVYPREVARRALELNASALILVHNHPSGDSAPSASDIEMTTRVARALATIGVDLHDHIIVGISSDSSFRSLGLLDALSQAPP